MRRATQGRRRLHRRPSTSAASRAGSTASYAGAAFSLLLALFLTYIGIAQWSVTRRSRGAVAVVVKSEVAPGGRPEITYRYAVGGSTYESPFLPHLGDGLDEEQRWRS